MNQNIYLFISIPDVLFLIASNPMWPAWRIFKPVVPLWIHWHSDQLNKYYPSSSIQNTLTKPLVQVVCFKPELCVGGPGGVRAYDAPSRAYDAPSRA